jgi:hypothetical protein
VNPITAPTVGRMAWYNPGRHDGISHTAGVPLAAIVAYVHSDRLVNLHVIDQNGDAHPRTSVAFVHESDVPPEYAAYCSWMPYQTKKHTEER